VADSDPEAVAAIVNNGSDERLSWADIAAVARAHCELGNTKEADDVIGQLGIADPDAAEFRSLVDNAQSYLHGVTALAAGDARRAVTFLSDAYDSAPGEAACALALAVALATTGDRDRIEEAADLFEQVAVADPTWVAALAGLAWALDALGRTVEAARVLTAVPPGHPLRPEALTLACRAMEAGAYDESVAAAAGERVRSRQPGVRGAADAELAASLYRAALAALGRSEQVGSQVGRVQPMPHELAKAAEQALLELADATPDPARRHELLDAAARTRPWSLW
jgi:tetratricopeptide (TPR) repeat protein